MGLAVLDQQIRTYLINLTSIHPLFPSPGCQWLWGEAEKCIGFNYQVWGGVFWAFLNCQASTRGQRDGAPHYPGVCTCADCGPNWGGPCCRCWRGREGSWTEPHWTQAIGHCHPQAVYPYPRDWCPSSGMRLPMQTPPVSSAPGGLGPCGERKHDSAGAIQATRGDTICIFHTKLWTNALMGENEIVLYLELGLSRKI